MNFQTSGYTTAPWSSAGAATPPEISTPMASIVFSPRQEAARQECFRAPYRQAMGAITNLRGADEYPVNAITPRATSG
jgi:hypothetical protein